MDEIGITPVWICPFRAANASNSYNLYILDPRILYINFGFWDTLPAAETDGYHNRKVEKKLIELDGEKAVYSSVYFDEETFWELKRKYDPDGVSPNLYEKCVVSRERRPSR